MTTATWTDAAYEAIATLLGARTGLSFAPSRCGNAEAGIDRAMSKAGIRNIAEYREGLQTGLVSVDDLIAELTVGETYFFREPVQFEFIRDKALPEIRCLRCSDHVLRVWSAGCASGEEAYSLAILFEEEGLAERAHILATDISRGALARAREAAYSRWSFRGVDDSLTRRYFRRWGDRFLLADRLRERVGFEYLNLALDAYPSFATGTWGMDLILCRNVLIYFDRETIRRVARHLFESLAAGGWLMIGASDPPLSDEAPYETVATSAGVFYRRSSQGTNVSFLIGGPTSTPVGLTTPGFGISEAMSQGSTPARAPFLSPAEAPCSVPEEETISCPAQAVASDPLAEARDAFAGGDYGRVLALTSGLKGDPSACALRVHALANLGDAAGAEKAAGEAVSGHPLSRDLPFLRATLLMGLGREEEAAQAVRRVIYLDRSLAIAHFSLGSILERRGDLVGARRAYRTARDLAAARPRDEIVPLSDGEPAGRLAEAARAHLAMLEAAGEDRP